MTDRPIDPERIADETARQLLERAAELDSSQLNLAQLREAAAEAGISPAAFDAAVAEWRRSDVAPKPNRPRRSWPDLVARNVVGIAAGWAGAAMLAVMDRLLATPWLVHKLTDPIGLALGAFIAIKLEARVATVLVGGLAVSQTAEFLMDLMTGAPAVHGFGAHMGLMIAGVLGVALGSRILRASGGPTPPGSENVDVDGITNDVTPPDSRASRSADPGNAEVDERFRELMRSRHSYYVTRLQPG